MPPSRAAADLAELFSKARLALNIPSSAPSSARSVVFFDEVLNVETILTLPSDTLLPIASSSTQDAAYSQSLPLPAVPQTSSLGHQSIPPHLHALLACIHVNLLTDYVPQPSSSATNPVKSTNPYEPLASVQRQFEHLQLLPSHNPHADPNQAHHAAVRAFSNAWAGNQSPKPHRTLKDAAIPSGPSAASSTHRAYLTHDGQHWSVHWHCRVPINFMATPFQPLLSVSAALTLRLDHALLDHFVPSSSNQAFVRSGFAHSLLTPLHEGPVYPDESPLQSQARAKASSALGLDGPDGLGSYLAHLPKDVVGGNNTVVTPRSGASALNAIQNRSNEAVSGETSLDKLVSRPNSNGDLATLSSRPSSSHNFTPAQSLQGTNGPKQIEYEERESPGLQIYKRSTRQVLPLKTGLNVRMRTLLTQHDPHLHRRSSSHQPLAELESTRLVLSVELENPIESDSSFVVNDIQIKIDKSQADQHDVHRVVAKPLQPMASVLPIQLTRSSQHNMLFYVSVEADHAQHGAGGAVDHRAAGARNVTITVSGRPQDDQEQLSDFDSQWNCALDLAPVLSDAIKKEYMAQGPSTGRVDQPAAGPVAGNAQYSASSLRAAALGTDRSSYAPSAPSRQENADNTRTPRPGHLGMGFPPPLRTSSARYFSTATAATTVQHRPSSDLLQSQASTSFLDKAKARALHTRNASKPATRTIQPWMSTSTGMREVAGGGLVVLSTLRRAGASARLATAEGEVKFESSLGEDGVARPSVSTGAKTLHPTSISLSSADERAARFQTGDTVFVDLVLLYRSSTSSVVDEADEIADITLSWVPPPSTSAITDVGRAGNRDSIDTLSGLTKGRLMDADSARLRSSLLTSQAETLNGLIPLQDHLSLQASILPSQSRTIALGLRCLSPGYHAIPPLQLQFQSASGGRESVSLDGLGHVFVTPAAVL